MPGAGIYSPPLIMLAVSSLPAESFLFFLFSWMASLIGSLNLLDLIVLVVNWHI